MYANRLGRFTSVDPWLSSGRLENPQTWNRYIYVGNNSLNITDPTGLDWYYNEEQNRYKWFDEGAEIEAGYTRVVGSSGQAGSFVYESTNGKWITLNPYANNWQEFDTQAEATKRFIGLYNCNSCQELAKSIAENVERKGTTVAIVTATGVAIGTGVGVAIAATGTAVGGTVTTLGLTEATATTATTATAATVTATNVASRVILNTADDIISAAGKLTRLKGGVRQGFIQGNPQQILQNVTQGATRLPNGGYRLADGTIIRLANSSRGGDPTFYINKAGQLFKIRVQL